MTTPTTVRVPAQPVQPVKSLRTHWLQGAGVGVLLQGIGLVFGFATNVFVARLLGPHGLGQYSYVLAIVAVLSVMATLGLPTVIARLLATYQSKGEWAQARGILKWSNLVIGSTGLLLGLGLVAGGMLLDRNSQLQLYLLAAPLVVVLAWTNIRQRALQGLHRPLAAQLPEQFIKHSVFLSVGVILWISGYQFIMRPNGVMAVWLLASTASLLFGAALLRRLSPPALRTADSSYEPRAWLTIALPILFTDVLGVVLGNTDTIILGWLRSLEEVGLYQVAFRLSIMMLVLLGASNWVLTPWFARFHATSEKERLQSVVTRTTRAIFAATLVLYLVAALWGKTLLGVFFGEKFVESYPILLILGAGQLINVACGPAYNLLAMTGGQRELAWSTAAAVMLNILLCLLLIPGFGLTGAAISVAITTSAYNVLLAIIAMRRCGIAATVFG